jgi:hypothetical protein
MDTSKPAKQPLKRRRCPNCNKVFQPTRRWARFHSDKCRKEFHRYGAGYYPIKAALEKAIEEKYAGLEKQIRVELKQLRAEIDALRDQFEKHHHNTEDESTGRTTGPIVGGMSLS